MAGDSIVKMGRSGPQAEADEKLMRPKVAEARMAERNLRVFVDLISFIGGRSFSIVFRILLRYLLC